MLRARPLIALLTDFGLRDHYVAVMKAVVLGICPEANLVDITHDVPPHDVRAGALELAAAYSHFPAGTIFLVIVDPGVGSARRALAADAGGRTFVAPDNGVLTGAFNETPPDHVVEITNPRYARSPISPTFEGRDRFAPAAGWLATGIELGMLGPTLESVQRLDLPRPRVSDAGIDGEIVRIDRFGNLVTNIDRHTFELLRTGSAITIDLDGHRVSRVVTTYADAPSGELCALVGSSNHLEIAANGSSAASLLGASYGAPIHVRLSPADA